MTLTTKEEIKRVLEKWKFPVLQESEQSLLFRYQMSYIQTNITVGSGSSGVAVTLSGIFTANDEKETGIALRTCNHLNHRLLQTKLYIDEDSDLIIASEFFFKESEDMEFLLRKALDSTIMAKVHFLEKYLEYEVEANFILEIEQVNRCPN